MVLSVVWIISFVKIVNFGKQIKLFPNEGLFWGTQQTVQREEICDYLVELKKYINTGGLQLTLGKLISLKNFGKHCKKPVLLLKFLVGKDL